MPNSELTMQIPFVKMVGAGNDFLIVDAVHQRCRSLNAAWPQVARAMCDRRYGVGADGLLVLEPSKIAAANMRVFNSDGSEAKMCGNGARCVASYLKAAEGRRQKAEGRHERVTIETKAGLVSAEVHGNQVSMWMSKPKMVDMEKSVQINNRSYSLCFLDTGVPHAVVFVKDVNSVDVQRLGRMIRHHEAFRPHGTNVDFVNVIDETSLAIRTYERGVEAETFACGTGAVAGAIAAVVLRRVRGHIVRTKVFSSGAPHFTADTSLKQWKEQLGREYEERAQILTAWPQLRQYADEIASRVKSVELTVVNVHARCGEVLKIGLTLLRRVGTGFQIVEVSLEGSSRRIFEGVFSWS